MKELQVFRGHKKEVMSLAWHPIHESMFASGGADGSILFWIVGSVNVLLLFILQYPLKEVLLYYHWSNYEKLTLYSRYQSFYKFLFSSIRNSNNILTSENSLPYS